MAAAPHLGAVSSQLTLAGLPLPTLYCTQVNTLQATRVKSEQQQQQQPDAEGAQAGEQKATRRRQQRGTIFELAEVRAAGWVRSRLRSNLRL